MLDRHSTAIDIARSGGALALHHFRRLGDLAVESKAPQDFVTEADRAVETHIRDRITAAFPGDGIVGEEHAPKLSDTGYTWVIDPIDGTANFIAGIPAWCVLIAVVRGADTVSGVTCDPVHDEMFAASAGQGATLNGARMVCPPDRDLARGTVGVGMSGRIDLRDTMALIDSLGARGGVFLRNASGGLSLAYAAAGRLLGYVEGHMNAWDALAGKLLVSEAGGVVQHQDADDMIARGGRVVAGSRGVFEDLVALADGAFGDQAASSTASGPAASRRAD